MINTLMFCMLCITAEPAIMPDPTPEIKKLTVLLGHDKYEIRESADKQLRSLGWDALKAMKEAADDPKLELEVRERAKGIYNNYLFRTTRSGNIPSIWLMATKTRFPDGCTLKTDASYSLCETIKEKDIAKEYYAKAKLKFENFEKITSWQDENVAAVATCLYVKDLLLSGKSPGDVVNMLDDMEKTSKDYDNYRQSESMDLYQYDWQDSPLGPLIPKKDFNDPNLGGPA